MTQLLLALVLIVLAAPPVLAHSTTTQHIHIDLPPQVYPWDRQALTCLSLTTPRQEVPPYPTSLFECLPQMPGTTREIEVPNAALNWLHVWTFYDLAVGAPPLPAEVTQ